MNCSQVQDLLPDYSVEILDARKRRAVELHLAECDGCRRELRELEAVVSLVERYGARQPPAGLFNAVRHQIEAGQVRRDRPAWWSWLYTRPARALAMGVAMAAVALGLFMPVGQAPQLPSVELHPSARMGGIGLETSRELANSIRQHAMSAGEGPLTDRVAWEAMAQLVSQDRSRQGEAAGVE